MRKLLLGLCIVVALAYGCSTFEKAADDGAAAVIEHQDTIEQVTEAAQDVVPPPFDWIIGIAGGGLVAAAGAWIAYRQGRKKGEASTGAAT